MCKYTHFQHTISDRYSNVWQHVIVCVACLVVLDSEYKHWLSLFLIVIVLVLIQGVSEIFNCQFTWCWCQVSLQWRVWRTHRGERDESGVCVCVCVCVCTFTILIPLSTSSFLVVSCPFFRCSQLRRWKRYTSVVWDKLKQLLLMHSTAALLTVKASVSMKMRLIFPELLNVMSTCTYLYTWYNELLFGMCVFLWKL